MMNPWLGIAVVPAALGTLLGGLRLYQKLASPQPELVRKILHVGMGLVAVSFPWLFDRSWPVVLLLVLSVGGMVALRTVSVLRCNVGTVVSGVGRASLGEIYFPLAIAIQWHIYLIGEKEYPHRVLLYCIPLLLLTLADAVAALVGVNYGRWRYPTSDGLKSTEGSFAFFLCAFLCVHVPLLLATDVGRLETLLIALLIAWLAMMFEAIAWGGLDNLVLPLVAHLLLKLYLDMKVDELESRLLVTAVLTIFVFIFYTRTTLQGSAVLGACLVGYVCWSLGGWRWLLAPLILFLAYSFLSPRTEVNKRRVHNIHAVVAISAAGLIWLFLYRLMNRPEFLYLSTLAFAAELAIIAVARLGYDYPRLSAVTLLAICVLEGWLLIFGPFLVLERSSPLCLPCAFWGLVGVAVAAIGFYLTQPQVRDCPADVPRWLRQAVHGALGSAVGLVPLYLC